MRIAYFDCFAGISGDMTLGALIAAGADLEILRERLAGLPLDGYELQAQQVTKRGIAATDVTVEVKEGQPERGLADIVRIIESGSLADGVKDKSIRIFRRLAEAEARVHGCKVEEMHFHEVGAVDAIVDIVGSVICLDILKVEQVLASPMPLFHGFVECRHGRLPLPAPATVELLKGVPVRGADVEGELVTPTGAAIITTLASGFGPAPVFRLGQVGYGAGKNDYGFPNTLRVMIGESEERYQSVTESMALLETNMDDMNPQFYDAAIDRLFSAGARDVFLTPIQMKKNRPAVLLSVLCDNSNVGAMLPIIYEETSTLGVRITQVGRACLARTWQEVDTAYGPIRVKIGSLDGKVMNTAPEYEDCRAAAVKHNVPVKTVYEEASAAFNKGR